VKIKQYITLFIALFFLGLFFSKAQSNDSTAFKAAQDSTDINSFLSGTINNNPFWKQQVLSNQGGAVLNEGISKWIRFRMRSPRNRNAIIITPEIRVAFSD